MPKPNVTESFKTFKKLLNICKAKQRGIRILMLGKREIRKNISKQNKKSFNAKDYNLQCR